jgi:hypothetical protein
MALDEMLSTQHIVFTNTAAARISANYAPVRSMHIEPSRSNTHLSYVGDSTLTQNGSAGVIRDLAIPTVGGILDSFDLEGQYEAFDEEDFLVWGFLGESVNVTILTT